jgi:hypothetical protein
MSLGNSNTPKDKEVVLFNVFTSNFDLALKFNENRILTHQYTPYGNPLVAYDPIAAQYFSAIHQVITDNAGNVVVV